MIHLVIHLVIYLHGMQYSMSHEPMTHSLFPARISTEKLPDSKSTSRSQISQTPHGTFSNEIITRQSQ